MTNGQLRVGVLGVGFGSVVHVPAFRSEGWDLVAVWSRREERAREQAAKLDIPDVHADYREIIARDDVDAVAIATPPAVHHEMAIAALRAGKHVLCEKPFALSAQQAKEMLSTAEETGLTAMVAHEFRFAPQRSHIKELLEQSFIGQPQLTTLQLMMGRAPGAQPPAMTWGSQSSEGGGLLGALGSHYIDGLRHWFGDVSAASGQLVTFRPARLNPEGGETVDADTDDSFAFTLRFKNGVMATMTASSAVAPSQGARILVTGSDGVLLATQRGPNPEPDGTVQGAKADARSLEELPMPERFRPFEDDRDQRLVAFRLLVREFERGIREGTSPAPNFEDGLRCQEVLDAVRASAAGGGTVTLS